MSLRRIGFSLWYGNRDKKRLLESMREIGFDYVEISLDYPWPYEQDFQDIVKKAYNLGFKIGFHGPWRDLRLASPINEVAEASRKVVKKVIENISHFEPEYFNLHLISEEITFDGKVVEKIVKRANETIRFLEDLSNEFSIVITLENNPHGHFACPTYFAQVSLGSLEFCLDVGHAIIAYYNAGETSYTPLGVISDWINIVGKDKIYVVHLHDVIRKNESYVNHYFFGLGILDLKEISKFVCEKTNVQYILFETFRKNRDNKAKPLKENEVLNVVRKNCK